MQVFLSYSHADQKMASKVGEYLREHGINAYDPAGNIASGEPLLKSVFNAISSSNVVLFFISKHSFYSSWVNQEVSVAVSKKLKGEDIKIIPILIEKNAEVPFFLKDYSFLDLTVENNFNESMKKLILGLNSPGDTTTQEALEAKFLNIELQRELLKLEVLKNEEYKKFKSRQLFLVSIIATSLSAIGISIALLSLLAKVDNTVFYSVIAFFIGIVATVLGSVLYMRKEKPYKREILNKIDDIRKTIDDMGASND